MREYEFRGKLLNTKVWIYGNLSVHLVDGDLKQKDKRCFIEYNYMNKDGKVYRDSYEVDPSTIGQFTGLYDKNGIKIYEGNIVEFEEYGLRNGYICFGEYEHSKCYEYACGHYGYYIKDFIENPKSKEPTLDLCEILRIRNVEVIGNMYDKEEL